MNDEVKKITTNLKYRDSSLEKIDYLLKKPTKYFLK
jgi:hypothetical protein